MHCWFSMFLCWFYCSSLCSLPVYDALFFPLLIPCQQEKNRYTVFLCNIEDIWICRGHCVCWLNRIKIFYTGEHEHEFQMIPYSGAALCSTTNAFRVERQFDTKHYTVSLFRPLNSMHICQKMNMRLYDSVTSSSQCVKCTVPSQRRQKESRILYFDTCQIVKWSIENRH